MLPARVGPIYKSTTADAAGRAVVTFPGPGAAWRQLDVDAIALTGNSSAVPTATLYRGSLDALGAVLAIQYDGNGGAFRRAGESDTIAAGESWAVVWSGCTAGATMAASLTGTERDR